jgi:hypothetical protein
MCAICFHVRIYNVEQYEKTKNVPLKWRDLMDEFFFSASLNIIVSALPRTCSLGAPEKPNWKFLENISQAGLLLVPTAKFTEFP